MGTFFDETVFYYKFSKSIVKIVSCKPSNEVNITHRLFTLATFEIRGRNAISNWLNNQQICAKIFALFSKSNKKCDKNYGNRWFDRIQKNKCQIVENKPSACIYSKYNIRKWYKNCTNFEKKNNNLFSIDFFLCLPQNSKFKFIRLFLKLQIFIFFASFLKSKVVEMKSKSI